MSNYSINYSQPYYITQWNSIYGLFEMVPPNIMPQEQCEDFLFIIQVFVMFIKNTEISNVNFPLQQTFATSCWKVCNTLPHLAEAKCCELSAPYLCLFRLGLINTRIFHDLHIRCCKTHKRMLGSYMNWLYSRGAPVCFWCTAVSHIWVRCFCYET